VSNILNDNLETL